MNESDYTAATDLAKVRIALDILRDIDGGAEIDEARLQQARNWLVAWRLALERRVAESAPPDTPESV